MLSYFILPKNVTNHHCELFYTSNNIIVKMNANPSSYNENKRRKENASMAAVCGTLSIHKCNEGEMPFAREKILSKYLHEKNVCQVEVVISNIPHSLSHRVVEPQIFHYSLAIRWLFTMRQAYYTITSITQSKKKSVSLRLNFDDNKNPCFSIYYFSITMNFYAIIYEKKN